MDHGFKPFKGSTTDQPPFGVPVDPRLNHRSDQTRNSVALVCQSRDQCRTHQAVGTAEEDLHKGKIAYFVRRLQPEGRLEKLDGSFDLERGFVRQDLTALKLTGRGVR